MKHLQWIEVISVFCIQINNKRRMRELLIDLASFSKYNNDFLVKRDPLSFLLFTKIFDKRD